MTHEEQMRLVVEYMGMQQWEYEKPKFRFIGNWGNPQLDLSTSPDWLNPVWVKVKKELEVTVSERSGRELYNQYHINIDKGDIKSAFEVVVEAILFIQKNKK